MFGWFKKNKNLYKDLENIENEFQKIDVDELMNIMMRKKKPQGCQGCGKGCNNKNQGCNKGHGKRKN
jgi:energy-converting hydrogenase A subunit M